MRIAIVEDDVITAALPPNTTDTVLGFDHELLGEPFSGTLVVEGVWSGDRRLWAEGATSWRPLPLPFMGLQETTYGHDQAEVCGILLTMERVGAQIRFGGRWLKTEFGESQRVLWESGALRGISGDWDDYEMELLLPEEWVRMTDEDHDMVDDAAEDSVPVEEVEGERFVAVSMPQPRERYTRVRAIGATVVPFPAFVEGKLDAPATEAASAPALVAAGAVSETGQLITGWLDCECADVDEEAAEVESLVASAVDTKPLAPESTATTEDDGKPNFTLIKGGQAYPIEPPMVPPHEWVEYDTDFLGTDLIAPTVTNEGRLIGYLAGWGTCHIAFPDECVTPPQTATDYAHFLTGELILDDGSRCAIGQVTINTGHADLDLRSAAARAHYDNTGTGAADVNVGEDELGIWVAGAVRPGLTALDMRRLVASDLSGDWRRIAGNLELVAALGVNVPGYHKGARSSLRTRVAGGVVESMVAAITPGQVKSHRPRALTIEDEYVELLAASIGRSRQERIDALAAEIGRTPEARLAELIDSMKVA